jgi:CheY-like chemotaxis protein
VTDAWDERTEAIPGTKGEKSFELELDFVDGAAETAMMARASLVVFEPTALGLADALVDMGFDVRMGTTGVDVMSVVAHDPPGAVLCAPAADAERRRLLAAALRLRFPHIPIVYVSTHAGQEDAVLGALREGARAVLAWPLPSSEDVMRVLAPYLASSTNASTKLSTNASTSAPASSSLASAPAKKTFADMRSATGPAARPETQTAPLARAPAPPARTIASVEDDDPSVAATAKQQRPVRAPASADVDVFDEAATVVTPSLASRPAVVPPAFERATGNAGHPSGNPAGNAGGQVPMRVPGFADEPTTQPNMRPAAAAVQEALDEKRGEIGDLLAAVSPFLWSLEDASRWAGELGAQGDPVAQSHARTLTLLAKILAQLQARIDDVGI